MFDISNGCGSCSSFGMNEVPVNQVMQVDQTSQYLANMVAANSGNGMANNGGMVNNANNRVAIPNVATVNNGANNNQAVANAAMAAANNKQVAVPVANTIPAPLKKTKSIEFGVNYFLMVGLAVAAALAFNETAKYHINQAIKFNEGSPMYYVAYAGVMVVLAGVVHHYLSKN